MHVKTYTLYYLRYNSFFFLATTSAPKNQNRLSRTRQCN